MSRTYVAIDLKSFYASVECIARGLDPLSTNLVVADASRTEKTICLAVTPSLKAWGIPGRARLFEVVQKVSEVNVRRRLAAPGQRLTGSSADANALREHPELALDYLVAPPRMALYMQTSARIYGIYLQYVAPEDIHVYSVDEVFIDATPYLHTYRVDGAGFARMLIREVYARTGITATAGIGTNLYLSKVAMDIVAKKAPPDETGVRMAFLDELRYRELLWSHQPLTDFWRVGGGISKKLARYGMYTMGDVARCSLGKPGELWNEDLLYRLFGVNAELLIDHAWGIEPCTMADIKAYRPENNSLSTGQVLSCPYSWEKAGLVLREMADELSLRLVERRVVTDAITLTVGYDMESLTGNSAYSGSVTVDRYGRTVPKSAHGSIRLPRQTASTRLILQAVDTLYRRITDPALLVRRMTLGCGLIPEEEAASVCMQLDLFADPAAGRREEEALAREKRRQQALLDIKQKFGKNAILRGMDLEEGATAPVRNAQIGGHKA